MIYFCCGYKNIHGQNIKEINPNAFHDGYEAFCLFVRPKFHMDLFVEA